MAAQQRSAAKASGLGWQNRVARLMRDAVHTGNLAI